MKRYLVLLAIIPTVCFSQTTTIERPDKEVEPDPYTDVYFSDGNSYSQVKRITMVTNGSWRGFQPDTIQQAFFEDGNKVQVDKYRNNEVNSRLLYNYNEAGRLTSWENKSKGTPAMKAHYFYDDEDRINKIEQYSMYEEKGDSALRSRTEAMYTNDELTSINTPYMQEKYKYARGKLMSKSFGGSKKFEYDRNGNLVKVTDYFGAIDSSEVVGMKFFYYNDQNQLILDSIASSTGINDNIYQKTWYEYDGDNLISMKVKYKEFYRDVNFKYKKGKIQQVDVSTNRGNSAYLRHWMDHRIGDAYTFPVTSTEIFEYDDEGNKIAKKVFVNEELFVQHDFVIEY